jgi:hypothetical protein
MKVIKFGIIYWPLLMLGCGEADFAGQKGSDEPQDVATSANVEVSKPEVTHVEDRQAAVAEESAVDTIDKLAFCQNGDYEVQTQRLNFNQRQECRFGAGDNLPRLGGFMQAKEEQTIALTLPEKTVLCGMELASPAQDLHYDDYLFLTLNQNVLVASEVGWADLLTVEGQTVKPWNWEALKGQDHAPVEGDALYGTPYCLGDEGCQVPMHDATGGFAYGLDFAAADQSFYDKLSTAQELAFTVIATGDDDDGDCDHSTFQLDLTLKLFRYGE